MMGRHVTVASELGTASVFAVLHTENSIRVDTLSNHHLSGDDRTVLPLPGPVRLAVQVERPDLRQIIRRAGISSSYCGGRCARSHLPFHPVCTEN